MSTLLDHDFDVIVDSLEKLAERSDPSNRKECWRTADELLLLFPSEHAPGSARELDAALCARFFAMEDCPIRFAYYPHEDSCKRLWGHIKNVGAGPGRSKLRVKLEGKRLPLEGDHLGEGVRTVSLSHALGDHHFAARVRLNLARHGIRSWLAEGDLHDNEENLILFEAVEASLHRCHALMMLVSSISICSAWVFTEAQSALGTGKEVLALIDASDAPICKLLQGWAKDRSAWLDSNEGIQVASEVLELYLRTGPPKTRVLKFRKELEYTLNSITMAGCVSFYPDVPLEWEGKTSWMGFERALDRLGTQKF
jgi:hypothetical protein